MTIALNVQSLKGYTEEDANACRVMEDGKVLYGRSNVNELIELKRTAIYVISYGF